MQCENCHDAACDGGAACQALQNAAPARAIAGAAPAATAARQDAHPPGVRGWCWGGFLLTSIWAIGNRTWIGLLALAPYVGWLVQRQLDLPTGHSASGRLLSCVSLGIAVYLGLHGRELAWKNGHWDSVEHFRRVQTAWTFWGVTLHVTFWVLVIGVACWMAGSMHRMH